jgi:integrase
VRKDGGKRLLSWLFAWTWAGYIEALDWKIGIESQLRTAKAAADKRGSKLYMPTVREEVDDYLADPDTLAMSSREDRKRHLAVLVHHCGNMLVNTVTHLELREIIKAEHARGLSYESLKRLWAAVSRVFNWMLENDRLDNVGFLKKVKIPESARHDRRPRTMLTDEEFWALVECAQVPLRYRALYIVSRLVGGMRASDLHALRWGSVDTKDWAWCLVTRPKTDGKGDEPVRLELETEAAAVLKEYYLAEGRPAPQKYVFGRERDRRDGEGDKGGRINSRGFSYARRLRGHLKLAGVKRIELHKDFPADDDGTGGSRRAHFHSFRHLFCTSLAIAGVNIQTAMGLAGHRRAETAMRYVDLARVVMAAPSSSKPKRASRADTEADTASGPSDPSGHSGHSTSEGG